MVLLIKIFDILFPPIFRLQSIQSLQKFGILLQKLSRRQKKIVASCASTSQNHRAVTPRPVSDVAFASDKFNS